MAKWTEEQRAKFAATMARKYGKKFKDRTKEVKRLTVRKSTDIVSQEIAKKLLSGARLVYAWTGAPIAESLLHIVENAAKGK
jgi:hypothetical protein